MRCATSDACSKSRRRVVKLPARVKIRERFENFEILTQKMNSAEVIDAPLQLFSDQIEGVDSVRGQFPA
jgi:hypothetical protein